jgi:hypothetical protein
MSRNEDRRNEIRRERMRAVHQLRLDRRAGRPHEASRREDRRERKLDTPPPLPRPTQPRSVIVVLAERTREWDQHYARCRRPCSNRSFNPN